MIYTCNDEIPWQMVLDILLFCLMNLAKHKIIPKDSDYRKSPLTRGATQSTYSIYKRLANLVLAIFFSVICINLWLLSTDSAQNWYDKQANQLGRSLSTHSAKVLALALAGQDNQTILNQLQFLSEDPHVDSASVYDKQGVLINSTATQPWLLNVLHDGQGAPLVFIQDIKSDGNTLGYLRLLLNEQQVMRYHDDYQQQIYEQILVLVLLAGAVGLLIARAFYKFRYRNYQRAPQEVASPNRRIDDHAETPQRSLGL